MSRRRVFPSVDINCGLTNLWPLSAIVIAACIHSTVAVEMFDECVGKENIFVASRSNCNQYIYCDGNNSFRGECLDDNYFNAAIESCDDRDAVQCPVDMGTDIAEGQSMKEVHESTNSSNNTIERIRLNITSMLHSIVYRPVNMSNKSNFDSSLLNGSIQLVSETLTVPLPLTTMRPSMNMQQWNGFASSMATPLCPQIYGTNNLVHLPNPESCASYYTCYHGIAIPMICGRFMKFNTVTARCERQEQVNCSTRPPLRFKCDRGIYDFIPHPRNCQYYYFCSNGFLMIFQCPYSYAWDYERRLCVHRSQAKCFSQTVLKNMLGLPLK